MRIIDPDEFDSRLRPMLSQRFRFEEVIDTDAVVIDPFTDRVPFRGLVFPCLRTLDRELYERLLAFIKALREPGFYASSTIRWEDEPNDGYYELSDSYESFLHALASQWEQVFYSPVGSWLMWFSEDESVLLAAEQRCTVERLQAAFWPVGESARTYAEHLASQAREGALLTDWRALASAVLTPIVGPEEATALVAGVSPAHNAHPRPEG